ncbi:MAG: VCBS repeat-containing protein [Planctomycetia bacterium]|nr:VCBS repeat-containing protein [Planctomycetia bacterium]
MWFRSAMDSLQSRSARTPVRQSSRQSARSRFVARHISIEPLEERRMLSFSPAASYPVGASPAAVVSADFNADGRLDLATANPGGGNVSVLLGKADGTFQAAQNSATGASPLSLAVGDFNADGKLDLATANAGNVSVLLGNGNGTFQAPVNIDIGSSPSSVAVGDFNADGKLDLGVTSNVYFPGSWGYGGWYPGYYYGQANVLLGTGSGSFGAPTTAYPGYGYQNSTAVADFNSDGNLDFATAGSDSAYVSVLLGTGTGALGAPNNFLVGASQSMAAGDVNGDGKADLVTANPYSNQVGVLLGTGTGFFGATQYYATGSTPHGVAVADFNADGKADIVTANWDGTVSVLLGSGAGAFLPPAIATVGTEPSAVAVGDFNGDGRVDAATSNAGSNNVSVLLNDAIWPALNAPSITITDPAAVTEGNTGTVSATFTVNLSAAYGQTVTVQYATANGSATAGSDYQAASGTLTFAPGQTSKTIVVLVTGDRIGESNESFLVNLSGATNAFIADAQDMGTILDDEPYISITDYVSGAEGNTGATPFSFTVTLSAAYDTPVTVDYATADLTPDEEYWYGPGATAGVDYQAKSGTVTFAPGETSQTITVLVNGDRLVEWYENFFVNLSNPSGAQLSSSQALGVIADDEPYVSIDSGVTVVEGNTGTTSLVFTVSLSAAYDAPVTVNYATSDNTALAGSDYVATSGTLTFAPGQTSLSVPVMVNGDTLAEIDEYVAVQLSGATNGSIANGWGYGTILDDDTPPAITISDASIIEGNSGTTLMTFTVYLSQASGNDVWVNYTTANGNARTSDNDYVAKSGTIYFAPGETTKTIEVLVRGDTKREKNERFYVNLSGAINGTISDGQGVGTILNDDGGGRGHNQTASASAIDAAIVDLMTSARKKRDR